MDYILQGLKIKTDQKWNNFKFSYNRMRKGHSPNHTSLTSEPGSYNLPLGPVRNQDPFFKTSQISTPLLPESVNSAAKKNLNKDLSEELRLPVSSATPNSLKIRKHFDTPHFAVTPYEDSERTNLDLLKSPKLHVNDGLVLTNSIRKEILRGEKLLNKSYQDLLKKNVLQSRRSLHPSADSEEDYDESHPLPSKLNYDVQAPLKVRLGTNPQKLPSSLPSFLDISEDALLASHKTSVKEELSREEHSLELPRVEHSSPTLYSQYPFKPFPGSTIFKRRNSHRPKAQKKGRKHTERNRESPSQPLLSISMSPQEGSQSALIPPRPPSLKKSRKILKELSGYLDNCLDALVPKLRGELRYSHPINSSSILSSQQYLLPVDLMNQTFMSTRANDKNREAQLHFRSILQPALQFHSLSPVRPRTQGGASKYIPKRHTPDKMQATTHQTSKSELVERPKSQDKLQVSAVGSIIERSPSHQSKLLTRKVSFAEATTLLQSRPVRIRNPKASDSSLQIDLEKKDVVIPTAPESAIKKGPDLRTTTPLFVSDSQDEAPTYRHILTSHATTPHDIQGQNINLEKLRHRSMHPVVRLPPPRKITKDEKKGLRQIFQHLPRELPSYEPKKLPKASFKLNNRMPLYPALLTPTQSTSLPYLLPQPQKDIKSRQHEKAKPKREVVVIEDGEDLERGNALKIDLATFQGKYTWIQNESEVPGSKKQVSEAIEKQRQFQQLELSQFLEHCSYHLGKGEKEFNFLSLVDGTPVQRLQDIPGETKCLVVSQYEHFLGLPCQKGFSHMFEHRQNPLHKQRTQEHLQSIKAKWINSQQREWRSHSSPYLDNTNSIHHLRSTNSPTPSGDPKVKVILSKNQGFFKLNRDSDDLPPITTPLDSSRKVLNNYHDLLSRCSSNVARTVKLELKEIRGLVVMKLKKQSGKRSSGKESPARDGEQTRRTGGRDQGFEKSNLEYDEVRSLAHRYHLPNKFIYQIFSEFIAMREMILKEKSFQRRDLELPKPLGDQSKKVWRLALPLSFLKSSSPFFVSKHPELVRRILSAMGVAQKKEQGTPTLIDVQTYFHLKALLEFYTCPAREYEAFWLKVRQDNQQVIDPYGHKVLKEDEFLQVFGYIAEGSVGSQSNLLFSTYAGQVKSALEKAECLDEEGRLHMDLMEQALKDGKLGHSVFTNTLKYDCDYRMKGASSSLNQG